MHGKMATIILILSFFGEAVGKGRSWRTVPPPTRPTSSRWPSKRVGNSYLARQVNWCKRSDESARSCANELVWKMEQRFGKSWGCMVTKPGYGSGTGYYYHWDTEHKYGVQCFPFSNTKVNELVHYFSTHNNDK